ncbi:MAG: hypothetical protein RR015_04600 [Bacteroidales bacterium]
MKKIISALFLVVLSLSVSMAGDVMSPYTKDILKQRSEHVRMKSLAGYPTEKELISCYVTVDSDDVIERLIDYGVGVNSVIGNIITAMIPLDVIDNIAIMAGVIRIEAGDVHLIKDVMIPALIRCLMGLR